MKISAFMGMSLNGYIAREDGDLEWLQAFHLESEDFGYRDFFNSVDVLVMGRNTYEKVLTFDEWPYGNKRVIILSNTLKQVQHGELFHGSVQELVQQLKKQNVQHVYVDGGMTVSNFLKENLLDEITISIVPMVIRRGIRFFVEVESKFELISSKAYPNSLIQLKYRVQK